MPTWRPYHDRGIEQRHYSTASQAWRSRAFGNVARDTIEVRRKEFLSSLRTVWLFAPIELAARGLVSSLVQIQGSMEHPYSFEKVGDIALLPSSGRGVL